ncbi:hypothetical protein ACFL3G_12985 [Planctomycetota bacterium]
MRAKKTLIAAAVSTVIFSYLFQAGICFGKTAKPVPSYKIIHSQMKTLVDLSTIRPGVTFSEALDILRKSVNPQLNLIIFWRHLRESSSIDTDTPVYLDGIGEVPAGKALQLLLASVSNELTQLDYVIDGGVVIVGLKESIRRRKMTLRVYDSGFLTASPADFTFELELGRNHGRSGASSRATGTGRSTRTRSKKSNPSRSRSRRNSRRTTNRTTRQSLASNSHRAYQLVEIIKTSVDPQSWY